MMIRVFGTFCSLLACVSEWLWKRRKRLWKRKDLGAKNRNETKSKKTPLKGMGLQASRPGTRNEGSRIPKILEKQLMLQRLLKIS